MKNLLGAASLLVLIASCSPHQNQKVNLNFGISNKSSSIGDNVAINVIVHDDRRNPQILGTKKFGDEKIDLIATENLAKNLQERITENLMNRGFNKGKDKIVDIHIEALRYNANRGFPLGNSEINSSIKIIIRNTKTNTVFTKNYSTSLNNKHFIVSTSSTDSTIINSLLEENLKDILGDDEFLQALISQK